MSKPSCGGFISVVMTTYNGEKYLREQIDSILQNITEDDEFLIGDDGSEDATLEILNHYKKENHNITIVNNDHLGTSKNLEKLITKAKGDSIFIADQDDVWESDKVEKVCKVFDDNPEIDLVFHNSKVSGADVKEIVTDSLFDYLSVSERFWDNVVYFHFWGCMLAIRSRAKEYILPFRFGFDSWMIFCTTFFKRCHLENKVLMTYRRHGGNLSSFHRHNIFVVLAGRIKRLILFLFFLPYTYKGFKKI